MRTKESLVLALVLGGVAPAARALELQQDTVEAWQEHVRIAGVRTQSRLQADKLFLWTDETTERKARVLRGEIVVEPSAGSGMQTVPKGLIHDWIGAVFIRNASIDSLRAVLSDYDRYPAIYKPAVTNSRSLGGSAGEREFTMTWQRRVLFVNAAMQGWYQAHNFMIDSRRGYSVVESTRIQQIEDCPHCSKHLLPPDSGSGFIWRILSITRYEQRDGGVYLEIEAIGLTRDIPPSIAWLVSPVVRQLAINSLMTTLRQTREVVQSTGPK